MLKQGVGCCASSDIYQLGRLAFVPERLPAGTYAPLQLSKANSSPGLHSILKHVANIKFAQVFGLSNGLIIFRRLTSINGAH